jgi:hypothetical protein
MLDETIQADAVLVENVLISLRALRNDPDNKLGKRELSEAISFFELGSMKMIRSMFTTEQPDYMPTSVFNGYKSK